MGPLRWGILSAGKISNDFTIALSTLPKEEHEAVAVGARNLDNAKKFGHLHGIPKAYGSYAELVKDNEIDVIYIGSIHVEHVKHCKLALNAGKHVLCEKPLGMNVKETVEVLELAKSKGLFFMEAVWSRFLPAYKRLKEELDKGTVGEVLQVVVSFGDVIQQIDRMRLKSLGGGTVLDIGIYCVQFASLVFGREKPEKIVASGILNEEGVDESTNTNMIYKGGRAATMVTHSRVKLPNMAFAIGTKGTLKLSSPFWCATELTLPSGEVLTFPLPKSDKETVFVNSTGLSYQCEEVRRCILSGINESPVVPHAETLHISEIMETIRKQVGVEYEQDV